MTTEVALVEGPTDTAPAPVRRGLRRYSSTRRAGDAITGIWSNPLLRNGYLLSISSASAAAIGFGFWAAAAWRYDATSVGSNSAAISMMVLVATIAQLNLASAMVRFVPTAGRRTGRFVATSFIVSSCLAIAVATTAVVAVRVFAPGTAFLSGVGPAALFVAGTVVYALFVIQNGVLVGIHRAGLVPAVNVAMAVGKLGAVVALASILPFHGIFASWVIALAIVVLGLGVYLFGWAIPKHQACNQIDNLPPARHIRRFVAFDYAGSISSIGSIDLMPLMVVAVLGAAPNAYFAIAWVIAYSLHLVNANMGTSLVAESAGNLNRLPDSVRHVLIHTSKVLVPAVVATIITAPLLLSIFGPDYRAATVTLQLLALAAIPNLVVATAVSSARAQRRLGFLLSIQLTQCVVVLSLTWILLHTLGLTGAGLAWLISQTTMAAGLLTWRRGWMLGRHFVSPELPRRRARLAVPATWLLILLRLLTKLRLRTAADGWVSRLRGRQSVGPIPAAVWAEVAGAGCPGVQQSATVEAVPTVSDVAVGLLRSRDGQPCAVVKVARGPLGARELHTQRLVLDQFATDPRLTCLQHSLPRVLTYHEGGHEAISVETFCPGDTLASLLRQEPEQVERLATEALQAIALLHVNTGRVTRVEHTHLHRWVGEPLTLLAGMCHKMDPRMLPAVDHVGEILSGALMQRKMLVSWTHGDFTPDNITFDGVNGPVRGIVDWGGARPNQLAMLDGYLLTLSISRLMEASELGVVVRRRLRAGGLVLRERRPLRAVYHSAESGTPDCDRLDERSAILLAWLHHAADIWRKCGSYQGHRVWWAANIAPVLRAVNNLTLSDGVMARLQIRRWGSSRPSGPRAAITQRSGPTVAVVICAYTEDRWALLSAAIRSVRNQSVRPDEILLVVDHCPELLARAGREFPGVRVLANAYRQGLSGARNTGVDAARSDVVAFLDDDAVAAHNWVAALVAPYSDPSVLGVGGRVCANWHGGRPSWFPPEFDWVVGCSYLGLPTERAPIRNFIGANMSLRRSVLIESGGFDTTLGRVGARPVGCEETELCIRVQRQHPEGTHVYEPSAEVLHSVPRARGTWSYYRSRCYAEGLSKARVSRLESPARALATERSYLMRTIPRGIACNLGRAMRGEVAAFVAAIAMAIGVMITALGYTVGRVRTVGADAGPRRIGLAHNTVAQAAAAGVPFAVGCWLISLPRIRLDLIGDFGLLPLLPLTFWVALATAVIGCAVLILQGGTRHWLLGAYLITLIVFLHATPSALYGTLRYSWAWKHVGVVDFFLRHHGIDDSIRELGVYQRWPGFFTLNATMAQSAGLSTVLDYAPWAPVVFNILFLGPLYLIYRAFTNDSRLVWAGLVVFVLGCWVGQDYFAPQPTAFFLMLTIIAVCVRYRTPRPRGPSPDRYRDITVSAAILLMVGAIACTHQLTPLMVVFALVALAFCRYRVRWLLPAALLIALGWDVVFAWPWISGNIRSVVESIGAPGANAKSGFINLSAASPSQVVVAQIDRAHSAAIGLLAILGFARRFRNHRESVLVLLALAPIPMFLLNDYGGEMIFRVYLFAMPFLAFYAAAAFFPTERNGRSAGTRLALPIMALVLIPGFLFSYYGKEEANYFSHREVEASRFVYGTAPRGSLIIGETSDFPWAFMNYEYYDYMRFALFEPDDRQAIIDNPVELFGDMMSRHHHAYLLITRSQIADTEMIGAMPPGSIDAIERELEQSPQFSVIFRNQDAVVITYAQPQSTEESV
ncbi:glycosyltransferase [Mycolicibacterium duvalii]|uniref:glycosyltransferase n=1 Tax=Mycolicibacterium duvalii TaxID=39688 RepID=UPI0013D3D6FF|nr:glycosyltransferase [Mycolicibacterium duvalii]MCV7366262.1 glycosyltransferase [Mycolicibacterium duvalii]